MDCTTIRRRLDIHRKGLLHYELQLKLRELMTIFKKLIKTYHETSIFV